jgi:hypothetical protein
MNRPARFALDRTRLRTELAAFPSLLAPSDRELGERDELLPFFHEHRNLAALLGPYNPNVVTSDVCQAELSLFGEHTCDLVVGQADKGQFCFVEFEDARRNSAFARTRKANADWSARLEHGFGQVIDWFRTLAGESSGALFREFFGTHLAHYFGLLVVGRDAFLSAAEHKRIRWRSQNTLVAGVGFDHHVRSTLPRP